MWDKGKEDLLVLILTHSTAVRAADEQLALSSLDMQVVTWDPSTCARTLCLSSGSSYVVVRPVNGNGTCAGPGYWDLCL